MSEKAPQIESVLFFSDVPWEGIYQRPHHLASGLAHRWPVLWVEPITLGHPPHPKVRRVRDNLQTISVPLFPLNARHRVIRRVARAVAAPPLARKGELLIQEKLVRTALRETGIDGRRLALLIQNFQLIGLAARFSPQRVLFDYIDDAFGFTEYPAWVTEAWRTTVRASDVITVTSCLLASQVAGVDPLQQEKIRRIPNGVEYARFSGSGNEPRPPDLPPGGRPVIGYVGSVYPWMDFDLLECLAREVPESWLVLVGPAHPEVAEALSRLARLPNVRILGKKPYADVPEYMRAFDVGLIPFKKTRLTAAVNPVKLYEYSAAGVPTVCTDFSTDLEELTGVIHTARGPEDFIGCVRAALRQRRDEANARLLQDFARRNDWQVRIAKMTELLED